MLHNTDNDDQIQLEVRYGLGGAKGNQPTVQYSTSIPSWDEVYCDDLFLNKLQYY
jgi:hypothetical protein